MLGANYTCASCLSVEMLDPLKVRHLVQEHFPPLTVDDIDFGGYEAGTSEARSVRLLLEYQRRQIVPKPRLHKPAGGWRPNQAALLDVTTQQEGQALLEKREREIFASLSRNYLAKRVATMGIFMAFCICWLATWPFRTHWPENRGDDEILYKFATYLSLRYTTYDAIRSAIMHVIEFHMSYLHVHPPPGGFPRTNLIYQYPSILL